MIPPETPAPAGSSRPPSPPMTQATQPALVQPVPHHKRFRRLAAKPLKPLKLAASAINSVRSNASTPVPGATFNFDEDHDPSRSASANSSAHLEPPTEKAEKERKRRSLPLRKKHDTTTSTLDPVQVAHAARGPSKPLDGELPAAVLRVRVCSAAGLVAKDRNGLSDPWVCMTASLIDSQVHLHHRPSS